jgi:uncharacterized protein (TIGR03067 family)
MRTYRLTAVALAAVVAASAHAQEQQQQTPPIAPAQTIQNPRSSDLPPVTRTSPPSAAALPKLAGTWTIVSGERNGQRLPDDRVAGLRVTITSETITIFDRANRPSFVVSYTLDTARSPNQIDMKIIDGPRRNMVARGIVTMDSAEEMRLIYSTGNQGRPAEFRTTPGGTTATLFILKRSPTEVFYAGEWQAVDAEASGKKLPPEQINKTKVVLTANTLVLTDPVANSTFVTRYQVNTTQTPNTIDMTVLEGTNKGKTAHGIIAPEGADRIRLCFSMGGERPSTFQAVAGNAPSFCYTLARLRSPVGVQPGTIRVPANSSPPPSGTPAGRAPNPGRPGGR